MGAARRAVVYDSLAVTPLHQPRPRIALPPADATSSGSILDGFLAWVEARGLSLYPAQEEAILALGEGKNVILATPTGSGKSLVAEYLHYEALSWGELSYYASPIKALANEKFFDLCRTFGPDEVGLATGDGRVNDEARVWCCTAEILANEALRHGRESRVKHAVLDEFHYYSDRERGFAWQVPLLELASTRFLLMSATIGDTTRFERALTELNGRETVTVRSRERPVPLSFEYRETTLGETLQHVTRAGRAPVYVVCFTQRAAAEEAQNLMSVDFLTKEQKRAIADELRGFRFDSPFGKTIERHVRHGVGVHHAGLLPKYRLLVERLAQKGLLSVICGTDTLGVGVNIPIRTVVLTKLCKFDGEKTAILTARDFHQITGRAGRKGFDEHGYVIAQAPEHVVENKKLEAKAGGDPVKLRRIVRKKPPEKGFVPWDEKVFERLVASEPEPLVSRFSVSHGLVLQVLDRESGDGCRALVGLLKKCHEPDRLKPKLVKTTRQLVRSLWQAGVIELGRARPDGTRGRGVTVHASLQDNFSMHQALSLFLVDLVRAIDRERPDHALVVLSIVEAILESPDIVLMKQVDLKKTLLVAELKAQGVEYEERMAALEKVEHDKPEAALIYEAFNDYAKHNPWIGENIRPKSIARAMIETLATFDDYVKDLGLERNEGTLLRYLSDVVKVLGQTVPADAKTEALLDVEASLRAIVTEVDASLLEEWERMRDPSRLRAMAAAEAPLVEERLDVTRDPRSFAALVRTRAAHLVRCLATEAWDEALALLEGVDAEGEAWTEPRLARRARDYLAEHRVLRTDPDARRPQHTLVTRDGPGVPAGSWRVTQVLCDDEGETPWALELEVDLARSRELGVPSFRLSRFGA